MTCVSPRSSDNWRWPGTRWGVGGSNPSGRTIQIWSKPPFSRLDRQLRGASYCNTATVQRPSRSTGDYNEGFVAADPQVFYPIPRFHHRWRETDSLVAIQNAKIDLVAIDICDQPKVSAT